MVPLSPRERESLKQLANGMSYEEAAKTMQISANTVKTHLSWAFSKLGARNAAHAVAIAYRAGIL